MKMARCRIQCDFVTIGSLEYCMASCRCSRLPTPDIECLQCVADNPECGRGMASPILRVSSGVGSWTCGSVSSSLCYCRCTLCRHVNIHHEMRTLSNHRLQIYVAGACVVREAAAKYRFSTAKYFATFLTPDHYYGSCRPAHVSSSYFLSGGQVHVVSILDVVASCHIGHCHASIIE